MAETEPKTETKSPFTRKRIAYGVGFLVVLALINKNGIEDLFKPKPVPEHKWEQGPLQGTGVVTPPPPPKQAGPAELAVVAPLKAGAQLGGWDVLAVYFERGSIWVVCGKDKGILHINVTLATDAGALAPTVEGPYAVFHSFKDAPSPDAITSATTAFNAIIKANAAVPVPPGLSVYTSGKLPPPPAPARPAGAAPQGGPLPTATGASSAK